MGLGRQNGLEFGLLHRDAEFALVVDLQLVIFALFIDGKTYAPVDELLHHRPSTLGHDIVNRFVHDALTSLAIGLDIQFRGFFRAWNGNDIHSIHTTRDAAGIFHIPLFKHDNFLFWIHLLRSDGSHDASAAASDDQHICAYGQIRLHSSSPPLGYTAMVI